MKINNNFKEFLEKQFMEIIKINDFECFSVRFLMDMCLREFRGLIVHLTKNFLKNTLEKVGSNFQTKHKADSIEE